MNHDPWVVQGDYELNYASPCNLPTLRPSPLLEQRLVASPPAEAEDHNLKVGVHLHVHYPEDVPHFLVRLKALPATAELLITTTSSELALAAEDQLRRLNQEGFPAASEIVVSENRGRNMAPLVQEALPRFLGTDVILHLHTKRSPHQEFGSRWREELLDSLLGDPTQIERILKTYSTRANLGLLMPTTGQTIRAFMNWGGDFELARLIVRQHLPRFSLDPMAPLVFPQGMMFWSRPAALSGWAEAFDALWPVSAEPLLPDGSSLHAMERLIAHFCEAAGFHWSLCAPRRDSPSEGEASRPTGLTAEPRLSVWQPLPTVYLGLVATLGKTLRTSQHQVEESAAALQQCQYQLEIVRNEAATVRYHAERRHDVMQAWIAELEEDVLSLRSSLSWRITGALRRMQNLF